MALTDFLKHRLRKPILTLATMGALAGCGDGGGITPPPPPPPTNHAPVLTLSGPDSGLQNSQYALSGTCTDQDGDRVTITFNPAPASQSGNTANYVLSNLGTMTFGATCSDGKLSDTKSKNVTVSPAVSPYVKSGAIDVRYDLSGSAVPAASVKLENGKILVITNGHRAITEADSILPGTQYVEITGPRAHQDQMRDVQFKDGYTIKASLKDDSFDDTLYNSFCKSVSTSNGTERHCQDWDGIPKVYIFDRSVFRGLSTGGYEKLPVDSVQGKQLTSNDVQNIKSVFQNDVFQYKPHWNGKQVEIYLESENRIAEPDMAHYNTTKPVGWIVMGSLTNSVYGVDQIGLAQNDILYSGYMFKRAGIDMVRAGWAADINQTLGWENDSRETLIVQPVTGTPFQVLIDQGVVRANRPIGAGSRYVSGKLIPDTWPRGSATWEPKYQK